MDLNKLFEPFPEAIISWRAQSVKSDGTAAMALAYIDARDVMNRLDQVCGITGWQCKYSHANGKTVCDIGILVDHINGLEWVWKADGAGDSDIEAEKGALSDAFKRAAVRWGVGRYLYDMPAPWVPCEAYQTEYNGKKKWVWKSWKSDPWSFVRKPTGKIVYGTNSAMKNKFEEIKTDILESNEFHLLKRVWDDNKSHINAIKAIDETFYDELLKLKDQQKQKIADMNAQRIGEHHEIN